MVKHCANCKYLNLKVKSKRYTDDYYKCEKKSIPKKKTVTVRVIDVCTKWELEDGTPDPIAEIIEEPIPEPEIKPIKKLIKKIKKKKMIPKPEPPIQAPPEVAYVPPETPLPEDPIVEEIVVEIIEEAEEKVIAQTPEERAVEIRDKIAKLEAEL